jgi:hypothetical protein
MRPAGTLAILVVVTASASATVARGDAYCDHVKAVAAADSATLIAPELFTSFGYVEQPNAAAVPGTTSDDLRLTLGVRYSLGDLYEGAVVRQRASADCRRERALAQVQTVPQRRALAARAKVLDAAMNEASKILDEADDDMRARRATAQEVMATRLRVDQLRSLTAETHKELDTLGGGDDSVAGALGAYYEADADLEKAEARLRTAKAWDLSVRFGYDKFLEGDDTSPLFGVVQATFDLGWIAQQPANKRAAAARRRMVRDEPNAAATPALRALYESETQRAKEASALASELDRQLEALRRIGGDDSRKFRQSIWFEWVEAEAEHAFLEAHVQSLGEALGEAGEK